MATSFFKKFIVGTAIAVAATFASVAHTLTAHAQDVPDAPAATQSMAQRMWDDIPSDTFDKLSAQSTRAFIEAKETGKPEDLYRFSDLASKDFEKAGNGDAVLQITTSVLAEAKKNGDLKKPGKRLMRIGARWVRARQNLNFADALEKAKMFVAFEKDRNGFFHRFIVSDAAASNVVGMTSETFHKMPKQDLKTFHKAARTGNHDAYYQATVSEAKTLLNQGDKAGAKTLLHETLKNARTLQDLEGPLNRPLVNLIEGYKSVLEPNDPDIQGINQAFGKRIQQVKAAERRNHSRYASLNHKQVVHTQAHKKCRQCDKRKANGQKARSQVQSHFYRQHLQLKFGC